MQAKNTKTTKGKVLGILCQTIQVEVKVPANQPTLAKQQATRPTTMWVILNTTTLRHRSIIQTKLTICSNLNLRTCTRVNKEQRCSGTVDLKPPPNISSTSTQILTKDTLPNTCIRMCQIRKSTIVTMQMTLTILKKRISMKTQLPKSK